ncbi:MAG: SMI1/KNR4 family protein [Bacteroidota bacterium]
MRLEMSDIIQRIDREQQSLNITLYGEASDADILHFEQRTGISLPDDFKTLYRYSNGFEVGDDLFRILPLENVQDELMIGEREFYFADYLVFCDVWRVVIELKDPNKYSILYDIGIEKIKEQINANQSQLRLLYKSVALTQSLAQFLQVLFDAGVFDGLYDWGEKRMHDMLKN